VDDLIGGVVAALGPAIDNTVLIVTSDNGYLYGEHRFSEKLVPYEESIRVPLFIRLPLSLMQALGATGYGRFTSRDLVVNTDLAPTIAAFAGVAAPGADGRSLAPALYAAIRNTIAPSWRKRFLVEHWWVDSVVEIPTYAGVRSGALAATPHSLYVEYYGQSSPGQVNWDQVTAREFYALTVDPQQLTNIPSHGWTTDLSARLRSLRTCGSGPGQTPCATLENA
jgi:hypothetical protein